MKIKKMVNINLKKIFNKFKDPLPTHDNKNKKTMNTTVIGLGVAVLIIIGLTMGGKFFDGENKNLLTSRSITEKVNELEVQLNNTLEKNKEIESELKKKDDKLSEKDNTISSIGAKISEKESEITKLQLELNQIKIQNQVYREKEAEYASKIEELNQEKSSLEKEREDLEKNLAGSVRTICCSLSNIKNNEKINWDIEEGLITCSGSREISCGTGEIA